MNIPQKLSKDALIMTAAINPGATAYVKMSDPEERLFQYLCSLVSWIQFSNISPIIFCENTGYDYDYSKIIQMAENFNKHLEILLFVGNNESYKYGKGWGEGKIIEYVFKNSKVLHHHNCFYKITGQYFLKNCDEIIDLHQEYDNIFIQHKIQQQYSDRLFKYTPSISPNEALKITYRSLKKSLFYLKRGQGFSRTNVDYRVVTLLYKANLRFFQENLIKSYKKVNDREGYVLEKVYCDDLKDRDFLQNFLLKPQLIGRSGGGILGLDYDESIKTLARSLMT
ncbi:MULTISPECIES: hypothetical protein [Microcystis]|uniref:hypothetical protein n=1 Tax=Microcystis TaxID=1125 RepID=UPI0016811563|nr:hypothetical protein [Microcystis wesenbergii]MBD2118012.1 hypothetical protein [Microcystis wesenbergii FACHB-1339]